MTLKETAPRFRILIAAKKKNVRLKAPRKSALSGFRTPERFHEESLLSPMALIASQAHVVPLEASDGVFVDGVFYPGALSIFQESDGTLSLVQEVPMEDYVAGVVAAEVSPKWPQAALEAQAIVARTYAFYIREGRPASSRYDLEATTAHQVYRGNTHSPETIRRAVAATRGLILTYAGKPIFACYHSNCGGKTAKAAWVWGKDQPYLKPAACPYDRHEAHYRWEWTVEGEELQKKLDFVENSFAGATDLSVLEREAGGRVLRIAARSASGAEKIWTGTEFRRLAGPENLRSTRFWFQREGSRYLFHGLGFGHGVGLCQEGAKAYAERGKNTKWILQHYYSGVRLEKIPQRP